MLQGKFPGPKKLLSNHSPLQNTSGNEWRDILWAKYPSVKKGNTHILVIKRNHNVIRNSLCDHITTEKHNSLIMRKFTNHVLNE